MLPSLEPGRATFLRLRGGVDKVMQEKASTPPQAAQAAEPAAAGTDAPFKTHIEDTNFFRQCWNQMAIMMRRNTILQYRYFGATLAQAVIAPFIFNLLVTITNLDLCSSGSRQCKPAGVKLTSRYRRPSRSSAVPRRNTRQSMQHHLLFNQFICS
jgi:hypothetical protein